MAEDPKSKVLLSLHLTEDSVGLELEGVTRNSYLVNSLFEGMNSNSSDGGKAHGDEDQYGEGDEKEREKEDRYEDEEGDEDQRGVEDQEESEDETEDEDEENEDEDLNENEDYPVELDLQDEQYHHQPLSNTIFASLEDAFSSDEEEDDFISIPKHIRDDDDDNDNDNDNEEFLPIPVSPWFIDLSTKSPPSENMSKPLKDKIKIDSQTNIDIDIQQKEDMDREQEETRRVYHDLYPPIYHEKRPIPLRDPWRLRSPVHNYLYHYRYSIC